MKSPNAIFEKPSLYNTASPTTVTYAEYEAEKSAVLARYPGKKGDLIIIYYIADIGYPSIYMHTPTADGFEFRRYINTHVDWDVVGKQIYAFFTVIRDGKYLGLSEMFKFNILDK